MVVMERELGASTNPRDDRSAAHRTLAGLFTLTSFASALLLFLVQPMVAKLVLPSFGGSPSVWNTAMVFFQASLLLGYLYAHVITRRLRASAQRVLHLVVIAAAAGALPIALPRWAPPPEGQRPAAWLLAVLLVMVGAPFVALATTGPLLQRWFSLTDHPRAEDPYFLYAASNAGSFLALLGYPLLLEPRLDTSAQASVWAWAYGLFVALIVASMLVARRHTQAAPAPEAQPSPTAEPINRRRRLRWIGLAFLPSSLMLGVTNYISTDVAAVPLLWVVPLALYLATFVVAFSGSRRAPSTRRTAIVAVGVAVTVAAIAAGVSTPLTIGIGAHLVLFACIAYLAHRRLADDRPAPERLTGFYLAVALGGVLGGVANALVAPMLFNRVLEYPLVLGVALVLLAAQRIPETVLGRRYGRLGRLLQPFALVPVLALLIAFRLDGVPGGWLYAPVLALVGALAATRWRGVTAISVAAVGLIVALTPVPYLDASRTFFGVYRVYTEDQQVVLAHGSTVHGREWLDPALRDQPLGYYGTESPIGDVFEAGGDGLREVAVIGLGVGTLAAYGQPDRHLTFYEIDPEVIRIARDSGHFHYLADSDSPTDYVVGDGRLELAASPPHGYDLIVIDAFSSDAIPVHLITREAVATYVEHLAPGGTIAFHISNSHLDLAPVLAGIAADLELTGRLRVDRTERALGELPSDWVALSTGTAPLDGLRADGGWQDLASFPRETWTDSYSNVLSVLKSG